MKEYFLKIIWFSIPLVFIFYLKPVYLLMNGRFEKIVAGNEIYLSFEKSKQKRSQKKVILGDSECYQLFPNTDNDCKIISLACNQAVGMVGHYLLLMNYINAGNEIDTLYMIFGSDGLRNNLDQVYTFHYFLKPFYTKEYKKYFSEQVFRQIDKIPYRYLCKEPYILTSNWAPKFKCRDTIDYTFLSPISEEYLLKIETLGKEHNFDMIILPAPISIEKKYQFDKIYEAEIINSELNDRLKTYFENIIYLNDTCFLDDGVHLKDPDKYSDYYKRKWIK